MSQTADNGHKEFLSKIGGKKNKRTKEKAGTWEKMKSHVICNSKSAEAVSDRKMSNGRPPKWFVFSEQRQESQWCSGREAESLCVG